jgi:hypothetical protein
MAKEKSQSMIQWENSPGFVYFIGANDPPIAIKIGISTQNDIKRRFSTIQGGNHEQLFLLGVIPFDDGEKPMLAAMKREEELHRNFGHIQHAEKGWAGAEWFAPSPELLEFVKNNTIEPSERKLNRTIYRKKLDRTSNQAL